MATILYSDRRNVLDQITQQVKNAVNVLDGIPNQAKRARAELDAVPTSLKVFIDEIAKAASEDPTNPAYTTMQAEALLLLTDCQTISQRADGVAKAVEAIG